MVFCGKMSKKFHFCRFWIKGWEFRKRCRFLTKQLERMELFFKTFNILYNIIVRTTFRRSNFSLFFIKFAVSIWQKFKSKNSQFIRFSNVQVNVAIHTHSPQNLPSCRRHLQMCGKANHTLIG